MKKIFGVTEIHDGGDGYITLVMYSGSVVHLPKGEHSITVHSDESPSEGWSPRHITVDYHAN